MKDYWCSSKKWSKQEREKLAWARGLKVGDMVCDCRYKHLIIKEVKICKGIHPVAAWLADKLTIWMGEDSDFGFRIYCWLEDLAYKVGFRTYVDSNLILEDDVHCSAMACCDDPTTCECVLESPKMKVVRKCC